MPPSQHPLFPPPPPVTPLFLQVLSCKPGQYLPLPSLDQLEPLATSIQACVQAAATRARNGREGYQLGVDLIEEKRKGKRKAVEYGYEHEQAQQRRVKEEVGDRERDRSERPSKKMNGLPAGIQLVGNSRKDEDFRKNKKEKPGITNGYGSHQSTPKIKRELSGKLLTFPLLSFSILILLRD